LQQESSFWTRWWWAVGIIAIGIAGILGWYGGILELLTVFPPALVHAPFSEIWNALSLSKAETLIKWMVVNFLVVLLGIYLLNPLIKDMNYFWSSRGSGYDGRRLTLTNGDKTRAVVAALSILSLGVSAFLSVFVWAGFIIIGFIAAVIFVTQ